MRTRTALYALGLALAFGLCAGCANTPPIAHVSVPPMTAPVTGSAVPTVDSAPNSTRCPANSKDPAITQLTAENAATTSASPSSTPLPADFEAVAVVRCEDEVQTVAGDGTWNFALAQRATSGLSALMTALRTPSSSAPSGSSFACSAVGIVVPDFALVDAQGRILRPTLPHDVCALPLTAAIDAVNALPWKTEAEQRLAQEQTQPELQTGCPGEYKDVFEFVPIPSASPWTTTVEPTMACEYTVSSATSPGDPTNLGEFSHGLKLTGARQLAIADAITNSRATAPKACSAKATRFALVTVSMSQNVAIELDGCRRMAYPDYYLVQAPSAVLTALRAAGIE